MAQFNIDSGSNYKFDEDLKQANVMRSAKDWSHTHSCTCRQGELFPIMAEILNPCTDVSLDVNMLTRIVNPPVVPLLSRQRLIVHSYLMSFYQLWTSAHRFFSKGYTTGDYSKSDKLVLPTITVHGWELQHFDSIFRRLGFNFNSDAEGFSSRDFEIPALKVMAFIKVWRDYYCNKRIFSAYLQSIVDKSTNNVDKTSAQKVLDFMFPLDDSDFRIGSSAYYDDCLIECLIFMSGITPSKYFSSTHLMIYRDWSPDYFTTAQLKPIFDTAPELPLKITTDGKGSLTMSDSRVFSLRCQNKDVYTGGIVSSSGSPANGIVDKSGTAFTSGSKVEVDTAFRSIYTNVDTSALRFSVSGATIDNFRDALSATLILEKMAKTDGSYREFMNTMFGLTPKSAEDFRPLYVGGTATRIQFTQVVNTTGSYNSDDSKLTSRPQGSMSGLGYGSAQGNIGHCFADEASVFLCLASIVPDTYYCQGMHRTDLYRTAEDFYLPERAGLGMQAILLREIFNSGDTSDNRVFGYIQHWEEWRYRANTVGGELSNPRNKSFFPYVQTRIFNSAPTLTPSFLSYKDNIPSDWLTSPTEVPYICEFGFDMRIVDPVPYRQVESTFGM